MQPSNRQKATASRAVGRKNMGKAQDLLDAIRSLNFGILGISGTDIQTGAAGITINPTSPSNTTSISAITALSGTSNPGLIATSIVELVYGSILLAFMIYQITYCGKNEDIPEDVAGTFGCASSCHWKPDITNVIQTITGSLSIIGGAVMLQALADKNDTLKTIAIVLIAISMMAARTIRFFDPEPATTATPNPIPAPASAGVFSKITTDNSTYNTQRVDTLLKSTYRDSAQYKLLPTVDYDTLLTALFSNRQSENNLQANQRKTLIIPIRHLDRWSALIINPDRNKAVFFDPRGSAAPADVTGPLQTIYRDIPNAMIVSYGTNEITARNQPDYNDGPILIAAIRGLKNVAATSLFPNNPANAAPDTTILQTSIDTHVNAARGVQGLRAIFTGEYDGLVAIDPAAPDV